MAEAKRFIRYRYPVQEQLQEIMLAPDCSDILARAFVEGSLKPGKKSDEFPDAAEAGEVVFDTVDLRIAVVSQAGRVWNRPSWRCSDCDGYLRLQKALFKVGNKFTPWFYRCSRHKNGCKVVVPAKVSGALMYLPAPPEVRKARALTNAVFDRLWQEAPDVIAWAGDPDELKAFINKAKARGYRYISAKMSELGMETQIQKMSIEELREAYRFCIRADINDVMKL